MPSSPPGREDGAAAADNERRQRPDRRRSTLYALLYGSFHPRRHSPRRGDAASFAAVDWHQPRWLAVAILILLLSCTDAFLTLTLIDRGAYEANPLMAPLVAGSPLTFTLVKIGLTAVGVVILTLLARLRAFRRIPISLLLYTLLAAYAVLVFYEGYLLQRVFPL